MPKIMTFMVMFCHWFKTGIVMNKPLDNLINKGDLDKPVC